VIERPDILLLFASDHGGFLFQDYPSYEFDVAEHLDQIDTKSAVGG
jgi:hypothetical protein